MWYDKEVVAWVLNQLVISLQFVNNKLIRWIKLFWQMDWWLTETMKSPGKCYQRSTIYHCLAAFR